MNPTSRGHISGNFSPELELELEANGLGAGKNGPVRTVQVKTVRVKTVRKKRSGGKNGPFVNGLCGNKGPSNQLPFKRYSIVICSSH